MELNLVAVAGMLIAATSLFMASLMFSLGKTAQNRIWGLFCLAVFVWGVSFYFIASTSSPQVARFWWIISHIGVILIPVLFIQFVYEFLGKKNNAFLTCVYALGVLFLFADLYTNWIINQMSFVFGQFYYDSPPALLYPEFFIFFQVLIIYGHYLLYRAYRRSRDELFRQQIRHFFMATLVGFLGGGASFGPVFGFDVYPTTILTVPLYPVIVGYAILKYRLFDMKVVTAQIIAAVIFIFTFVRFLTSTGPIDYLLNGGLVVIALALGVYLIRSVMHEVELREEIEKLSNEKSEFMTFASHEIRNPITAMRGYASLIFDGTVGEVSPQVQDVAQKILVNGDTVLSLISEFLNKSKVELGQISYSVTDVDIEKTIRSIVEGFKAHALENGLSLEVKIDFPGLMAKADEAKLREVVGNLIDNSLKYTKKGGVVVEVEKRNGMARVIISDTGVGIAPETLPNLFQKFSRADAQKMNLLGTGLGLYLAKTFIEGMGGKIWAESDGKDKGSRFIIELHIV
jgi:signal transduction histidine kinase